MGAIPLLGHLLFLIFSVAWVTATGFMGAPEILMFVAYLTAPLVILTILTLSLIQRAQNSIKNTTLAISLGIVVISFLAHSPLYLIGFFFAVEAPVFEVWGDLAILPLIGFAALTEGTMAMALTKQIQLNRIAVAGIIAPSPKSS